MGGRAKIKGGPWTHNETMGSVLHCPAFFSFFQNCPALSCILSYKCPAKSQKKSCIVLHCPAISLKKSCRHHEEVQEHDPKSTSIE